jgi:hydrogenase nickel incorporation protein HypA/HybF
MHELSVALDLVDVASREARKLGDVRVVAVRLRVGPLAGVAPDALRFSFDVASAGTAVEGARLEIEQDDLMGWCATCAQTRLLRSVQQQRCSMCEQPVAEVLGGDDLQLTALEVADAAPDR